MQANIHLYEMQHYRVTIFRRRWGSNQEYLDDIHLHLQNVCLESIDFAFPEQPINGKHDSNVFQGACRNHYQRGLLFMGIWNGSFKYKHEM